ncbi:AraC family transcriptional regulator [Prevotella sp. PCHR]|uniref:AraC family transcriptional regulator n=1 Tax=Xylanibacter caecicola TaxID=2736294 RepID=A0ABX2B1R0_9BACT|nr:helix-turn-helix domain-containing protein [Xylanibacter caecicola]NPE24049.1 AraC family transcriptional regulator [Xylanibacter caecicola]
MNGNITEISISEMKKLYNGSYIDDDIMVFNEIGSLPLPNEPRRMKCILLALCRHGKVQYSVDTEERMVAANDVIIISEGQVIDNYMLSNDLSGIAILISQNFFSEIIKDIHGISSLFLFSRSHPVFGLRQDEVGNLMTYFDLIWNKMNDNEHHFRKDVVRSLIATMIYDLSQVIYRIQQQKNKRSGRAESIFTEFIKLVEQNFRHERRVSHYATRLCITPKYLSETVKQVSHRTPNEWIDNYVALEIRVMLKNTTKSIKEIAEEMNFPNQSFLGRFFKEHVGMSPSEYRKS